MARSSGGAPTIARIWRATERWGLQEAAVVVVAFLVYFLVRGAAITREDEAIARARDIVDLQKAIHFNWELTMQGWIIDHYWLVKTMNWIYFWGHMPLVIVFAIYLWIRHRREYYLARNAFLASGAIAVVIYWAFPVAPPRLLPETGLIDTMAVYDRVSYNAQEASAWVNQYAAVPSLHFGWSMLLALIVARVGKPPWSWAVGVIWPVAMFFAIILTGNHFIFDAITGAIVSLFGLVIAVRLESFGPTLARRMSAWPVRLLGLSSSGRPVHDES